MQKSLFKVKQMDCGAEESLVRLQLERFSAIHALTFDLSARTVTVYHDDGLDAIGAAIDQLNLDSSLVSSEVTDTPPDDGFDEDSHAQRRLLWAVLIINFSFFVIEAAFGFVSNSMGLVADSLDMLADAFVYGLSLFAVGAALARKRTIAAISGYFQLSLAIIGFLEVVRRFIGQETLPDFRTMIVVSALALVANGVSLYLLKSSGSEEVHMKASMIFTSNDVVINLGVIAAGLLVLWLGSPIPDLVVGAIVFVVVMRGALRILKLAK